jgi:hypothetical protein
MLNINRKYEGRKRLERSSQAYLHIPDAHHRDRFPFLFDAILGA